MQRRSNGKRKEVALQEVIKAAHPQPTTLDRDPLLRATAPSAIVIVASTAGRIGRPGVGAYSASKAALAVWSDSLRAEEHAHGVHVGVVMPGFIATPKVRAMPNDVQGSVVARIPLQRFGETEELAGAVSFLLSPAAAYINGAVLRVDGGFGLFLR